MSRLFLALKLPTEAQKKIVEIRNNVFPPEIYNYKWEPEDKFHLTLKFIGEFRDNNIDELIKFINFIEDYPEVNFYFNKLGLFFRNNIPTILWIGMQVDDYLQTLVLKIEKSLEKFNVLPEKRIFKPHITLLRIKENMDQNFVNKVTNYKIQPNKFCSNEIALIKSKLTPTGSIYTDLNIYKLKAFEGINEY